MNVVNISVDTLLSVFPGSWPERLKGLHYSESSLAELKPRFENNWIRQSNLHLNLPEEAVTALGELADLVWSNETLRHFSLASSHFLFNAGDKDLRAFDWSIRIFDQFNLTNRGLFYLLSYLTHIDNAISVYREQRIPLDFFAETAGRIKSVIKREEDGSYHFSDYEFLCCLCEGKVINLNGVFFIPSKWEDCYGIWRNGLTGELREVEIARGQATDQISLTTRAREQGLDLNLWQLKLKPGDKILMLLEANKTHCSNDISHSLVLADRFFKDPDHFHNFVAFDFRTCRGGDSIRNLTIVLREEL